MKTPADSRPNRNHDLPAPERMVNTRQDLTWTISNDSSEALFADRQRNPHTETKSCIQLITVSTLRLPPALIMTMLQLHFLTTLD